MSQFIYNVYKQQHRQQTQSQFQNQVFHAGGQKQNNQQMHLQFSQAQLIRTNKHDQALGQKLKEIDLQRQQSVQKQLLSTTSKTQTIPRMRSFRKTIKIISQNNKNSVKNILHRQRDISNATNFNTQIGQIETNSLGQPNSNVQVDNFKRDRCFKRKIQYNQQSQQNQQNNASPYDTLKKYDYTSMPKCDDSSQQLYLCSQSQSQALNVQQPIVSSPQIQPQLSVIEQQQSVVSSSLPIRQKIGHLLPAFMGANYSLQHRKLIQSQFRLDQILDFLRLHRQKTKGQYLSALKRAMIVNYEIIFQLQHFKQILFLRPDFYNYSQKRDQNGKYDILITLPQTCMSLPNQLQQRKIEFRKKLFEYITENGGFGFGKNVKIPSYNLPLASKQQKNNKQILKQNNLGDKSFWSLLRSSSSSRINPFDALKPGNSQNFQEQLMIKIKQNEKRLKLQKQKQKQIKYGVKQLLSVFDQLPKIYKKRQKNSMFKSSIIQDLDKSLNMKQEIIYKVFDDLLEKYTQFFKVIQHKSGDIIQIQRKVYNQVRMQIKNQFKSDQQDKQFQKINQNVNNINNKEGQKTIKYSQKSSSKRKNSLKLEQKDKLPNIFQNEQKKNNNSKSKNKNKEHHNQMLNSPLRSVAVKQKIQKSKQESQGFI